jgi:hypothetical protein
MGSVLRAHGWSGIYAVGDRTFGRPGSRSTPWNVNHEDRNHEAVAGSKQPPFRG